MSEPELSRTVEPNSSQKMPSGIPYIVGNEAAERFSFYGMKAILFVYLTQYLVNAAGQSDPMTPTDARETLHWFVASAYFFPICGAIISDRFLGKYRTIFWLSLVYCLGHLALATVSGRAGLLLGLTLIAIGAGGIKPCVSAHVGDQFSAQNQHLLPRVYSWFYFSINFGAFFSTIITPILLHEFGAHWGPHLAFGLPGVLMLLATIVFWLGRNKFVHVKPAGSGYFQEMLSSDGIRALSGLIPLYLFVAIFWALYDQTASAWVEQADSMNRNWLGITWLSSQIQAVNPILVLVLIPICTYVVYPAINSVFTLTSLRKVAIGFVITAIAFGISAGIEMNITGGKMIRNAEVEITKENPSDVGHHELIVRLREHRSWNVKSVSWQLGSDPQQSKETRSPLTMRVDVGSTPVGPWTECKTQSFETAFDQPHLVELPEAKFAGYVRIVLSLSAAADGSHQVDSNFVNWKSPQIIRVLAAETSPPGDAHPHASAVWPDVAATGYMPSISWQLFAYVVLTLAEVMVSITCLEFSYTQAPNKMKSLVMSLYMLSVSLGNAGTALVNMFIQNSDKTSKLPGASYYWFFTGLMGCASLGFLYVLATYREKAYLQAETDAE